MSNDMNMVVLVGRLTRESELTYSSSGTAISKFSLAVGEKYKDKEEVSFVNCTMFGKGAEALNQYLTKGKQVAIQGKLKQNRWEKDGQKHDRIEVIVNSLQFFGDGKQEQAPQRPQQAPRQQPQQQDIIPPEDFKDDFIPF